jgi:hypothetical protein
MQTRRRESAKKKPGRFFDDLTLMSMPAGYRQRA